MLINIKKIKYFASDKRGDMLEISSGEIDRVLILNRKKGSTSGFHYHEGKIKSKNPEKFFMIAGRAKLVASNIDGSKKEEQEISKNDYFEIPPFIYHEVHALTDICFLELGFMNEDYENDTVRVKIE